MNAEAIAQRKQFNPKTEDKTEDEPQHSQKERHSGLVMF